jgi:hypothetical protein
MTAYNNAYLLIFLHVIILLLCCIILQEKGHMSCWNGVSAYHIFVSMEHSTNQNLRFFKDGHGFGILMLSG